MDFILSSEKTILKNMVSQFIEKECPKQLIRELDEKDLFPRELFDKLKSLEIFGVTIPEEYGGSGRDILSAIIILEIISRRFPALGWAYVQAVFYGGEIIYKLGTDEQRKKYLPEIAKGERIFSYALTEPNAGSDTSSVSTGAISAGQKFVINGSKTFITGADVADTLIVLVRTEKSVSKRQGLSMLLIDKPMPGLIIRPIKKLGYKCSSLCEIIFEDVEVDRNSVLGGPAMVNQGWSQLLSTLDVEHLEVAACGLGIAEGAFREGLSYSRERKQFGEVIGKYQAVSHKLADLSVDLEAARLLIYKACQLLEQKQSAALECMQAKLFATETAKKAALATLQIMGGYGYCMEYDAQRYLRDSLALTIGGGTSEILRNVIAKQLAL